MQMHLVAGDTLDFLTTVADYPASDGWTLKFRLTPRSSTGTAITLTAATYATADYRVQVGPATSALWGAGDYAWNSWVEKSGARYSVDSGIVTIDADPSALAVGTDTRSHARKVLDAIETAIETRAPLDLQMYGINGRQKVLTRLEDLLKFRDVYRLAVSREEAAAAGITTDRTRYVRFARA